MSAASHSITASEDSYKTFNKINKRVNILLTCCHNLYKYNL